ncbi:DUF4180 domain-containing protein [Listeria booriae]|uniref:DUF4180 domain-containing protein n=1 Tax=Listeria booriae TaxID=1552123 RepID=UPI001628FCAC|nr:DUF4180 domain-containing protein [Listeria booriae]MBC1511699.1 DUF4180 domain-containing protein [Listeria booriae]MBC6150398.1 DUF4180 domain-containing protein [Listeria booriae]MBC6304745.1 DUF4180 domain-containing protein [Listeria booriae]
MKIIKIQNEEIARIVSDEVLIKDTQTLLDLVMGVQYETGYRQIIVDKAIILEAFYDLKTKLLGEAFQKLVTYQLRLVIVGDYSSYTSKSWQDYMFESNKGHHVYFVETETEAVEKLKR